MVQLVRNILNVKFDDIIIITMLTSKMIILNRRSKFCFSIIVSIELIEETKNCTKKNGITICAYSPAIRHGSPNTKANRSSTIINSKTNIGKPIKINFFIVDLKV